MDQKSTQHSVQQTLGTAASRRAVFLGIFLDLSFYHSQREYTPAPITTKRKPKPVDQHPHLPTAYRVVPTAIHSIPLVVNSDRQWGLRAFVLNLNADW
jgi:hypothetical protein